MKTNYICLLDFMFKLNLSPTELICYATIYGFSQDSRSEFYGGATYLQEITNVKSRTTIYTALASLESKGLISKSEKGYKCVLNSENDCSKNEQVCSNIEQDCPNIEQKCSKIEHNNNIYNNNKYIYAEEIYNIYPRRVGKPLAIKSILKALDKLPFEELKDKTRKYADCVELWRDCDKGFVPHPSTWFNQERYNDNPSTWERNSWKFKNTTQQEKKYESAF